MDIDTARGVAARIWCDHEMGTITMDTELAEEIAQMLTARLTPNAGDGAHCSCQYSADPSWASSGVCGFCAKPRA